MSIAEHKRFVQLLDSDCMRCGMSANCTAVSVSVSISEHKRFVQLLDSDCMRCGMSANCTAVSVCVCS